MLTFTLLMAGAAALEVTYGKTKQCFVCGQGDFFDFGNDNDACAKVILEEHLRECDGLEDICKTTVTRQIFFEYDNMGEMVNTTVETFDRACAKPYEQPENFVSGEVYTKTEQNENGFTETEEVYCDKAGCNFHLAEEYPVVKEILATPNPILESSATLSLLSVLCMTILTL